MIWDLPKPKWTRQHARTLRALTVDEKGPGTIRRDLPL
jgi:hypothetical protein